MMPGSVGSNAITTDSVTSVTMLIHRICTGVIGIVRPNRIAATSATDSAPFVGRMYRIALRMFS